MTMISNNWGELLLPGLRTIYDKHMKKMRDYVPVLFNVETSKKAQEFNLGMGSLGLMDEWTTTGNQVSYEDVNKGFKSTYTHKKYSKGLKLERELVDDDQYSEIKKRTRLLAQSNWYTRQHYGIGLFNNAFNTSFVVGPDGKALCAADHPVAPNSGTTFSNSGTDTLNADAVEKTRNLMMEWKDDKGNLLAVNADTILVPPSLRKAAMVIADTDGEPDTANNNVNIWKGSLNVIECPFLTDSNNWFLMDSDRAGAFLNWYDRRKSTLESEKEFDSEVAKYKTVARFSFGFDDPTFIYGHNPA
jgi:phage major head subunit gpT-like protein